MMKKNILKYVLLSMTFFLGACNDFFNVETKNVLDHDGYITEESEMYSGYIGIMTKVQAIGDKVIYLTDTRDRKSTRLNSSHSRKSRMPSSA